MGVIVFASLKGGVGKTSLSINVAHSFARRRCRTLMIDLDPAGHSSRFFSNVAGGECPLARFLFDAAKDEPETLPLPSDEHLLQVRPNLDLLASGEELRHFLWGRGNQLFARYFPALIKQLRMEYDHVVIDTPPDFNTLTRNSLAAADLAIVPVDASEMSIFSLEELLSSARHLERPTWGIVRTMVNRKAKRSQTLSAERLQKRLDLQSVPEDTDEEEEFNVEDPAEFMMMLQSWEQTNVKKPVSSPSKPEERPIYLLRSLVHRTEAQNQLTFLKKTSLDGKQTGSLAEEYLSVAKEIESLLASKENEGSSGRLEPEDEDSDFEEDSLFEAHA